MEEHTPVLHAQAGDQLVVAHNLLLSALAAAAADDDQVVALEAARSSHCPDDQVVDRAEEVRGSAVDSVLSTRSNEVLNRHLRPRRGWASSRWKIDEERVCHLPFHPCRRNTWLLR